jgi:dTDP-4-dehydrorhamnose 3,5-epimerase
MNVRPTALPGVLLLEPRSHADHRGSFRELWRAREYAAAGVGPAFVQDNISVSRLGVVRGLHFQQPNGQGKLVSVLHGAVYDVAVDVRAGSPTFGRWVAEELSAANGRQLWVPAGFAHGFAALEEGTVFHYRCTDYYAPAAEGTVRWDDPALGIPWPVDVPVLNPKDAEAPLLAELDPARLPPYTA